MLWSKIISGYTMGTQETHRGSIFAITAHRSNYLVGAMFSPVGASQSKLWIAPSRRQRGRLRSARRRSSQDRADLDRMTQAQQPKSPGQQPARWFVPGDEGRLTTSGGQFIRRRI